jgi:hypothetical protein
MKTPFHLPDIEKVSAKVHEEWMKSKLAKGITSRYSETGEQLMVPYEDLSEAAKDLDRGTVKAVYAAIFALDPPPDPDPNSPGGPPSQ